MDKRVREMPMRIHYIIPMLLLCLLNGEAYAKKVGDLVDILNPFSIKVSQDIIYISDQYFIYYYSNDKLELLKKIGGKGEGPGEFSVYPSVKILQKNILVYIPFRIASFSKTGELLSEIKYNGFLWNLDFVKGNYVVSHTKYGKDGQINDFTVMDSNFKELKTISSVRMSSASPMKRIKRFLVKPLNKFQCYNGEIYVANRKQEGFFIYVFDHRGNPLRTIKRDYDKIKITPADRKKILDNYKKIPPVKRRWDSLTRIFDYTFPEYFPAIQDFRINDNRIYVKTCKTGLNGIEFVILNLNGKLLGKFFLPDVEEKYFDIDNNKFYYLTENDENEVWELHVINIPF